MKGTRSFHGCWKGLVTTAREATLRTEATRLRRLRPCAVPTDPLGAQEQGRWIPGSPSGWKMLQVPHACPWLLLESNDLTTFSAFQIPPERLSGRLKPASPWGRALWGMQVPVCPLPHKDTQRQAAVMPGGQHTAPHAPPSDVLMRSNEITQTSS